MLVSPPYGGAGGGGGAATGVEQSLPLQPGSQTQVLMLEHFWKNNSQASSGPNTIIALFSAHPVGAALHLGPALGWVVLGTASVWHHAGDVSASLVETDPVVSAPHSVLDNAHVENTRAVVQPAGHDLALHVLVLVVSLRSEHSVSLSLLSLPTNI